MSRRRIFAPRAWALALAWLLAASSAPAAESADEALARARELLAAGRLYPAEQAARNAVALEPERADAHRLLGQILVRRRKPELAVPELERAAALEPSAPGLARELALAQFDAGDCGAARDALRQALERDPKDGLLHLRLGQCELEQDRPGHAIPEFEQAARDPELREVAESQLELAREERSRAAAVSDAQIARGASGNDPETPWELEAGAGLFYESNVGQPELDQETDDSDGAGVFEFTTSYELPVGDWFDLQAGYDYYQSLYFEQSDFDLQSHTLRGVASREFGATTGSVSYFYSLNTLGGSRFLDLQELRPTLGYAPTSWWHATLGPGLRLKRFEGISERNADTGLVGTQQLFALGSWKRRLLLSIDGELEDADSRAFDYRGFATIADLRLPIPIRGELSPILHLRHRFRYRDYTSKISSPTGARRDRKHVYLTYFHVPVIPHIALQIGYEYEDATSDVESADYTNHIVGASIRFEL